MRKEYKVAILLAVIGIVMIFLGGIVDFYNDYKCSTTNDINWFIDNNCMRYVERDIRNK